MLTWFAISLTKRLHAIELKDSHNISIVASRAFRFTINILIAELKPLYTYTKYKRTVDRFSYKSFSLKLCGYDVLIDSSSTYIVQHVL